MYAGRIVERQQSGAVFRTPVHPYTKGLVGSLPRLGLRAKFGQRKLAEIEGTVPSVAAFPPGCRFHPRCSAMTDICRTQEPPPRDLPDGGLVRCHHA
jgi:peptide/nickel transport system ATP-binding protein